VRDVTPTLRALYTSSEQITTEIELGAKSLVHHSLVSHYYYFCCCLHCHQTSAYIPYRVRCNSIAFVLECFRSVAHLEGRLVL
jgi:hypothetical protein